MSLTALISATESLKKREGDLLPTLKTVFFEELKNKYTRRKIKDILLSHNGGSWGNDYFIGGIAAKVLRSPDIRFGFIDTKNAEERYFTQKEFDTFSLKNNDILVIKSNGSLDLVGKSQIYKAEKDHKNVIASNFLMVLSPNEKVVYPEYLDLFLKSPESLVWRFDTQKTTTGLRNLNSKAFLNIEIPLPDTIQEQMDLHSQFHSFIKGEIDEEEVEIKKFYILSKSKEKLSSELNHQLDLVKQLRKAFLREAMQGRFDFAQRPDQEETGAQLLEKIKAEKERLVKEGKIKKHPPAGRAGKPLPPITEEEIPFEIPENWVWCRLGEISQINPRNYLEDETEVGFCPMPLIFSEYGKDVEYETRKWKDIKSGFTHFANNDVVVAKITPCFQNSKAALIKGLPNGFGAGTTELYVMRSYINNTAPFIYSFIKTQIFLVDGERIMRGVSGQQRVPREYVESHLIPLPPLSEQQRIVAKLDELMRYCDELEASIKKSQQQNELLLQQVLREALEPKIIETLTD